MTLAFLLYSTISSVQAVPLQLTQQGRILDSSGAAVTGLHDVTFRIYTDASSGSLLWSEPIAVNFTNGYYAVVLGADEQNNALDSDTLTQYPLYLELQLDSNSPMTPRQAINSAPYAQMAGEAEMINGGFVNASEVQIGGSAVIDSGGNWVGPPVTIDWNDIDTNTIPAYITDGDDNTQLSEPTVESFITNGALTFATGSQIGLSGQILGENSSLNWANIDTNTLPSGLSDGDDDTLGGLSCSVGEITSWDGSAWICVSSIDDTLSSLACLDGEFARWDDILSEWYCASDSLEQLNCSDGEVVTYSSSSGGWVCTSPQALFDADSDGIATWVDCDDNDPSNINSISGDADCDGVATSIDCDDGDPSNTDTTVNDQDCDGTPDSVDCDDNDPNVTIGADGSSAACAAQSCNDILSQDSSLPSGVYYIDPDGLGVNQVYCDMDLDGGGWTLVYIDNHDGALAYENTSDQNSLSSLQSPSGGTAKFSDAYINAIREHSDNRIGYRVTSNDITNRYFAPSSCTYQHTSFGGNNSCRQYTASYTSSTSPSYIQCIYWGGGGGGLDSWYGCNGSSSYGYTNVFNTHRSYSHISGITTNSSGSSQGSSSTEYSNDVLMWVR